MDGWKDGYFFFITKRVTLHFKQIFAEKHLLSEATESEVIHKNHSLRSLYFKAIAVILYVLLTFLRYFFDKQFTSCMILPTIYFMSIFSKKLVFPK